MSTTDITNAADLSDTDLVRAQQDLTMVINRCLDSGNAELLATARETRNEVEDELIRRAAEAPVLGNDSNGNIVRVGDAVWVPLIKGDTLGTVRSITDGDRPVLSVEVGGSTTGAKTHRVSVYAYATTLSATQV